MQNTPTSGRATLIRYRDPKGAIDWLCAAFQFEKRIIGKRSDGSFAYAHLELGDHQVTVSARDENSLEPAEASARNYSDEHSLAVPDIAAHFEHAKASGAEIVRGLAAGAYACRDVEGHLWSFRAAKAPLLAWVRAHVGRVEKRVALAAAFTLTVVAAGTLLWQLGSKNPAAPVLEVSEAKVLEHARFALAEEKAARHAAEASRTAALAELARERTARLNAEHETRRFKAELTAARVARTAAEQHAQQLDAQVATWETQVARAAESTAAPVQGVAEIARVSAVQPHQPAAEISRPATLPTNRPLAAGQMALAKGDVAEARRQFRHLAEAGVAEAAFALGSTYDPVNVAQAGLPLDEMDPEQAKHWYRRAIEILRETSERQGAP